jgi:hypothetical protein
MNKPTVPPEAIAGIGEDLTTCPHCGAPTQLDHGTCLNCLLREGLEAKGEASRETFETILLEASVTDTTGVSVITKFWKKSAAVAWE